MSLLDKTQTFVDNADWLTEEDQPMVELLLMSAASLDSDYRAATANTFGVTYRTLLKSRNAAGEVDEDEEFLNNL